MRIFGILTMECNVKNGSFALSRPLNGKPKLRKKNWEFSRPNWSKKSDFKSFHQSQACCKLCNTSKLHIFRLIWAGKFFNCLFNAIYVVSLFTRVTLAKSLKGQRYWCTMILCIKWYLKPNIRRLNTYSGTFKQTNVFDILMLKCTHDLRL